MQEIALCFQCGIIYGVTSSINSQYSAMESISQDEDCSMFGINEEGPVAPACTDNVVEVHKVDTLLTDEQQENLRTSIHPLDDDGNHGCNLYLETVNTIRHILYNQ